MKLQDAQDLMVDLMYEHGIAQQGWSFAFDNAKRRCGCCNFHKRTIQLSRDYVRLNDEDDVRNTILHEIAHAIAGGQAGHGPAWRRVARRIGAKPERCNSTATMPERRYAIRTVRNGTATFKHRGKYYRATLNANGVRERHRLDSVYWSMAKAGLITITDRKTGRTYGQEGS